MNSLKRVRAFQIELEFGSVGFYGEGNTGVPGKKPLGAKEAEIQLVIRGAPCSFTKYCFSQRVANKKSFGFFSRQLYFLK